MHHLINSGGLDSLLEPTGTIKHAQQLAAEAFGWEQAPFFIFSPFLFTSNSYYRADRTFWVTNGTSTANKIVVQGLVAPNDIVLVDRNCHKSHHLGTYYTTSKDHMSHFNLFIYAKVFHSLVQVLSILRHIHCNSMQCTALYLSGLSRRLCSISRQQAHCIELRCYCMYLTITCSKM